MPKTRENITKLRQMRIKTSKQKISMLPSEIYLCVLGNGAAGSPRCLYMFTDHARYVFNCGEGTQRLAHEYKMKLSKLEHVFITHNSWENLGGLLGLSLTIQDIGVPKLTIHGPPNVSDVYCFSRSFVMTKDLLIGHRGYEDEPFVDNCMQVQYVPVFSCDSNNGTHNGQRSPSDLVSSVPKRRKVFSDMVPDIAVSYICKGHSKKGQLMYDKCVELGVPTGPLLGELKNGNDITLPSGKIVRSQDVTSADEPCPVFLVVECPSTQFLNSFVTQEQFAELQTPTSPVSLVVHFTPYGIASNPKYQEWMHRFPESTCHLMLNEVNPTTNSLAIHRVQHMLNLLHPRIFSLLHEDKFKSDSIGDCPNVIQAKTLCKYFLRPHHSLDRTNEVHIDPKAYVDEAENTDGFIMSLKKLHNSLEEHSDLPLKSEHYPEIAFLGTGSSLPSKVRNVSGILVNISSDCSMFMDCGEGSYNQLLRLYGAKETETILRNVQCIFISHLHADHHLGLFNILKKRKAAFDAMGEACSRVVVVAPSCINQWLIDYSTTFEPIETYCRFIDCSTLSSHEGTCATPDLELIKKLQNAELSTVPVQHCPQAYGCLLTMPENWKIVYSGDTIPCQQLVDDGKNCTLLIHEATMEDDLEDEAKLKMHSTTSQAIDIADQMNAKYTILTHFSQRYAKVPLFSERFHSCVGCAFDNMKVRLSDLPIISLFNEPLQILFAENVEKLIDTANKRKDSKRNQVTQEEEPTSLVIESQ